MPNVLSRTHQSPMAYFLTGAALFTAFPIANFFDILFDTEWAAPNPECDSLGVVLAFLGPALVVFSVAGSLFSGLLVIISARNKFSGIRVFELRQKPIWKNLVVSVFFAPLICACIAEIGHYTWLALWPHHIVANCDGHAENVVILDRNGPIFQTTPIILLGLALWLAHLRALALSPRNQSDAE